MILFIAVAVIWGSGAYGVKMQLGVVQPMISIIYRFIAGSAILLIYCRIAGLSLKYSFRQHGMIAMQGVCNFSLSYLLYYMAQHYITSGLAAVLFSTLIIMNMLNVHLFTGDSVNIRTITGTFCGLAGVVLLFLPEIDIYQWSGNTVHGILLALAGTYVFSLGNIISSQNHKWKLPVIQTTALSMLYGAIFLGIIALVTGQSFRFDPSSRYIMSLVYLTLFSSIAGYLCYLTLLKNIGAGRAAFTTLIIPMIAMGISTIFEGYQWSRLAVLGIALIICGNLIVMSEKSGLPGKTQGIPSGSGKRI